MWIIKYVVVVILSILFGQIVKHLNKKMPPVVSEEITYKEFFKSLKSDFKIDLKYSLIISIINVCIVYFVGLSVETIVYMLAVPMLMIVFSIDYRFQLIPDEAHVYFLLLGVIKLAFDFSNWTSYLFGLLIGGGVFLAIAGFAILILKKEGMGFGDVKLMASLGFLFGMKNIIAITLLSFFIGAIIGIILLIIKKKDKESYIPFGPFIVIGALILVFIGPDMIFDTYIGMCQWLGDSFSNLVYNLTSK